MKKYKLELTLFIIEALYMILELVASRLLSPYFGNTNLIWTIIIGIILLSSSIGNFIGGKIADKKCSESTLKRLLLLIAIIITIIPFIQKFVLTKLSMAPIDITNGALYSALALFFIPSMVFGLFSPLIIKLKIRDLENIGKTAGRLNAISTLGSLFGTFAGGFILIPSLGCKQLLFLMAIILYILALMIGKNRIFKNIIPILLLIFISIYEMYLNSYTIRTNNSKVLNNEYMTQAYYETQYGSAKIYNVYSGDDSFRYLSVNKGTESATFNTKGKEYELAINYTKFYDLMFKSNKEINNVLMIGGGGYSYPKYYISHYPDKRIDVIEIDKEITDLAKKYFYLDKLIEEYDLNNNDRLEIITEDGRPYLNKTKKKYDAILNDTFIGLSPAANLTTLEASQKTHDHLTKNGLYLSNVISSLDGENSKFLKAIVKTLKQVFKNVYVVPCLSSQILEVTQNNMVIATDDNLLLEGTIELNITNDTLILTDDYYPIEKLLPQNKN